MLLGEPPPTPFDLEFEIMRIPVRVSVLFWILPLVFGAGWQHPFFIIVAAVVLFTGVLVHELGHAILMRRYGNSPRIALTMMGGYATTNQLDVWNLAGNSRRRSSNEQIIISAGGPAAGFALAAMVIGILIAAGGWVNFGLAYGFFPIWEIQLVKGETFVSPFFAQQADVPTGTDLVFSLIYFALFVNIYWGILNLLPVYPLDGGQIAREVMVQSNPRDGLRNSLMLSVIASAAVGVLGLMTERIFLMIMFGIFAIQSWQMIQRLDGKGFGGGRPW